MIKNVKVYNVFLKYPNKEYLLKRFNLNLTRTFIYKLGRNKTFYYRKRTNVARKIFLVDKAKIFKTKEIDFTKLNLKKYKMRDISMILYEYMVNCTSHTSIHRADFDIAREDRKVPIIVDSMVRKDELVTMCFENRKRNFRNKFKNVFWINNKKQISDYNNNIKNN